MNDLQTLIVYILATILIGLSVWLIVVRRETGRNTVKLFGMVFDLSAPGLVVLVAGCGLLVLAAVVPHRPGGLQGLRSLLAGSGDHGNGYTLMRQEVVLSEEKEPNDSPSSANIVAVGQTIAGELRRTEAERDSDYFILQSSEEPLRTKRMIFRGLAGQHCCIEIMVWDRYEKQLARDSGYSDRTFSVSVPPSPEYVVRLSSDVRSGVSVNYEFLVVPDGDE